MIAPHQAGHRRCRTPAPTSVNVYRSPLIPSINTNALTVQAASLELPATVGHIARRQGRFLNAATAREPVAGARCRRRAAAGHRPHLPGRTRLARRAVVLPRRASSDPPSSHPRSTPPCSSASQPPSATSASTATPPTIYRPRRHQPDRRRPRPSSPPPPTRKHPRRGQRQPSPRPRSVAQRRARRGALNSLFLGLGAVSLLVGAVGVGNIMLIGVLERRSEIGLRRALGAPTGHIRTQFLAEAILPRPPRRRSAYATPARTSTIIYAPAHQTLDRRRPRHRLGRAASPPPSSSGAIAGLLPA